MVHKSEVRSEKSFKGPLKCLETHTVILYVDVILPETGRQGGTYQAAHAYIL